MMSICSKCGKKTEADALFCGYCGHDLSINKGQYAYKKDKPEPFKIESTKLDTGKPKYVMPNTRRQTKWFWVFFTLVFMVVAFMPLIPGLKGIAGGIGIRILAGLTVLIGVFMTWLYNQIAIKMDQVLDEKNQLASWQISAEDWVKFSKKEFRNERLLKKGFFLMFVIISIVVGVVLLAVLRNPPIMAVIIGLIVLTYIPVFWLPGIHEKKRAKEGSHVILSDDGVIIGNRFHFWFQLGGNLKEVTFTTKDSPYRLEFSYYLTDSRKEGNPSTFGVPVPIDKMEEAKQIAAYFNGISLKSK